MDITEEIDINTFCEMSINEDLAKEVGKIKFRKILEITLNEAEDKIFYQLFRPIWDNLKY